MSIMRHLATFGLAVALSVTATAEQRDPKAVEIAESLMEAMGGQDTLAKARYLHFSFMVVTDGEYRARRHHLWDTWEGRYRYESRPVGGETRFVLFNVNTKQGDAYANGEKLAGEEAAKALKDAYSAFINDSYWLMMPWKWLDPGVNLKYIGPEEYSGELCDIVELSFEQVGLTPGDVYRGYVSRASGLMIRWTYALKSGRAGDWDWEYVDASGIKLASNHRNAEGATEIRMAPVSAWESMASESFFTDPAQELIRKR